MIKDKHIKEAEEVISSIIGLQLVSMRRTAHVNIYEFGELDGITFKEGEEGINIRDSRSGEITRVFKKTGKFMLTSICTMRFIKSDKIYLTGQDFYIPKESEMSKEGFNLDDFNWYEDESLFEETIERHFKDGYNGYIVTEAKVRDFGDLTIKFENGFEIQIIADSTEYGENWSFLDHNALEEEDGFTVHGNGIWRPRPRR